MGEVFYSIHGVPMRIACDHAEVAERLDRLLAWYAEPEGKSPAAIEVEIFAGSILYPVPLHAKRVFRYGRLRNYYWEGISHFTDYFSTLIISPDGRQIRGNFSPETGREGGVNFFVDLLFGLALFEALRFHGLYYLHAAAVVDEKGAGYLISGNAGSGKTSLTLALLESGFRFLSDDTVFLRLEGERDVRVEGFVRDLHVPVDWLEGRPGAKFAGLPEAPISGIRKRRVPVAWFEDQIAARLRNPSILLFPHLSADGTRLKPLSMTEAMAKLLPQSMSVTFHPRTARFHLEALKRVICHARGFSLQMGPEIKGDAERCRALVLAAREAARKEGIKERG